ncbi:hypothetical protein CSV69_14105 [Sporosarcina sp. P26b]|nr:MULTISPECIES: YhzD family protein [Sporosarcina]ARK21029.1 hypothetical protein SporoP32a_05440 [Sporosarcina ureae]PIC73272.1 hypothetical protein CSV76_10645 [Sporosarcina sp. P17b]PIC94926.1 hypothetical protein CSV69_14105 [Sporosarcina sp. P26b]
MKTYKLTAYEKNGSLITEETFSAESDDAAKEQGNQMLIEKDLLDRTHRLASPLGKLLLFHT